MRPWPVRSSAPALQFLRSVGPQRAEAPLELAPFQYGQHESVEIARLEKAEIGNLCADPWRQRVHLRRQWASLSEGSVTDVAPRSCSMRTMALASSSKLHRPGIAGEGEGET